MTSDQLRDKLLRIVLDVGAQDTFGEADEAECRKRLGTDDETFNRLVLQLDQRGYLDRRCSVGSLKLSRAGIAAAERLP